MLFIVNTVRRVGTRTVRRRGPKPQRFVQRVCNGKYRLLRKRFVLVPEEEIFKHHEELQAKIDAGAIEIREGSAVGPLVDLATLKSAETLEEDEPVVEDAEPEDEPEVDGPELEEEEPDFSTFTKAKLVDYLVEQTGASRSELNAMRKAELLEIVEKP